MTRFVNRSNNHNDVENAVWRALRADAMVRQNGLCCWCLRPMEPPGSGPLSVTLEHIKQRSEGGENTKENTAASCFECNHTRPAADHILARGNSSLRDNPRLLRAAVTLANSRWVDACQARREAFYAAPVEDVEIPEFCGAARESVNFWIGRGVELSRVGDAHRIRDCLGFMLSNKLINYDESDAGRRYGRLYSEAHDILQPFLPPSEMMEWRLERMVILADIRNHLFSNDPATVEVMDAVCGKNTWIVGRFHLDRQRFALLKTALEKLSECIEMTYVPLALERPVAERPTRQA